MPTIENNSCCKIYSAEEFQKEFANIKETKLTDIYIEFQIPFTLYLEFPFTISQNNFLFIKYIDSYSIFADRVSGDYNVYLDKVPLSNTIQFCTGIPANVYIWSFFLYLPDKLAICSWDEIELMPIKQIDNPQEWQNPQAWRIQLLNYRFEENGDFRSTIMEPMQF